MSNASLTSKPADCSSHYLYESFSAVVFSLLSRLLMKIEPGISNIFSSIVVLFFLWLGSLGSRKMFQGCILKCNWSFILQYSHFAHGQQVLGDQKRTVLIESCNIMQKLNYKSLLKSCLIPGTICTQHSKSLQTLETYYRPGQLNYSFYICPNNKSHKQIKKSIGHWMSASSIITKILQLEHKIEKFWRSC